MSDMSVGTVPDSAMDVESTHDFATTLRKSSPPEVALFSTVASQTRGRSWRIVVRGAIYESETERLQKRLLIRLLRKVMKATPADFDSEIFRQRVRYFVARTEKGHRVVVTLGDRRIILRKKSRRNGQFRGVFRVREEELESLAEQGAFSNGRLSVCAETLGSPASSQGHVQLVPRRGWSVISDIDDTIKVSAVTDRQELLANTFLRPFRAVDGMADLYRSWSNNGAVFHYVSSSPWQLHDALAELCSNHGFPAGSLHLRSFRLRDHMLRRVLLIRRVGKSAAIRELMTTFPARRFILVGDSGERDAELYAAAARRFPQQVAAIYIRQLAAKPLEPGRAARIFRNLPRSAWMLFHSPEELPDAPCPIDENRP